MMTHSHATDAHTSSNHYRRLLIMSVLSFIAMYVLMYAMANSTVNVYANLNQFYMAALMTAPMVLLELALMKDMYHNKRRNAAIMIGAAIVLIASWTFIRRQTAIGDRQFLRSMIPHHAGAILMCNRASIRRPEIKQLCQRIVVSQQAEIDLMKGLLERQD
jgi:uncharacterized protein (DUF305 family)